MKLTTLIMALAIPFIPISYYSGAITSSTSAVKVHSDPGNIFTWYDSKDWLLNNSTVTVPLNIDLNGDSVYDASSSSVRVAITRIVINFTDAYPVKSIDRCYRVVIQEQNNGNILWEHKLQGSDESRADFRDSKFEWLEVPFVLPVSPNPLNITMTYNGSNGNGIAGTGKITVHGRLLSYP